MPAVTGVCAGTAQHDWSKGQHWNIRKRSWRILPSPIQHPQTSQSPGWSPPPSAGRHRPPGPGWQKVGAETGRDRLHVRQRGRHQGGCAGGRFHRQPVLAAAAPSAARSTDLGSSIPGPRGPSPRTPPQLHIPSSQTAGRARVTGPKTPAFPGPRAGSSGGWLQPARVSVARSAQPWAALMGGGGQLRPTASRREPARRRPPAPSRHRGAGAARRASRAGPDRGSTLTSTSRPLFLKLLMRWFSKPGFSAMVARGSSGGYSCGSGGGGESRCGRGRRGSARGEGRGRGRGEHVP